MTLAVVEVLEVLKEVEVLEEEVWRPRSMEQVEAASKQRHVFSRLLEIMEAAASHTQLVHAYHFLFFSLFFLTLSPPPPQNYSFLTFLITLPFPIPSSAPIIPLFFFLTFL